MPCRRNSPRRCDPILLTKEKYINIVIIDPPYGSGKLLLSLISIEGGLACYLDQILFENQQDRRFNEL